MKIICSVLVSALLLSPSMVQAEPWSWLDKPDKQEWSEITINGYERQVVFSIPDKAKWGSTVIRVPVLERGHKDQVVDVPVSATAKFSHRVIGFDWERRWGGFFKKDVTDYSLRVIVITGESEANLLEQDLAERMERIRQSYKKIYDESPGVSEGEKFFFESYLIEPYESSQGYEWTRENNPTIVKESIDYRLPISENRELLFWFYYRMEVKGPKKSPEWLERRKALSRKILDTVRIIPDPYTE